VFAVRQPSRQFNLIFWTFWTVFAGLCSLGILAFFVGDLSGGNATATVVRVYSQGAYTISFTARDGTSCETPHKWTPRAEPVKVGDTFEVHYSKISPCDNVERRDDWFARYGGFLIPPVFLAIGCFRLRRLRRRA
jgi:hypothetical protein